MFHTSITSDVSGPKHDAYLPCRLYHVREGADTRKQMANKSVPSAIRAQFYRFRLVLYKQEALHTVASDHAIHHDGHNSAEIRINQRYKIHDLRLKVQAIDGNNCPVCATHAQVPKKPVQPILTTRKGQLVMFDLTKFYVIVRLHITRARKTTHKKM